MAPLKLYISSDFNSPKILSHSAQVSSWFFIASQFAVSHFALALSQCTTTSKTRWRSINGSTRWKLVACLLWVVMPQWCQGEKERPNASRWWHKNWGDISPLFFTNWSLYLRYFNFIKIPLTCQGHRLWRPSTTNAELAAQKCYVIW